MNEAVSERDNLPKGWINLELQNCVKILDSKRIPVNTSQREQRRGIVPYYGSTGQVGWIDDHLFDEELVLLGEDGAPFFDNFKDTAYLISGKSWVNNHAHVLKGIKNLLLNKFLCYFLNQFDYHEYVTGTTRLKLNQTRMKVIPVLLPPLVEQKRIVSKIESIFTQIDGARTRLEAASGMLNKLRSSVLRQAFEGKLVSQDPNDEPAEFSLKRIYKDSAIVFEQDDLPTGWIKTTIGNIIEPSKERFEPINNTSRTFIGLEHIESNTGKIIEKGNSKKLTSTKTIFRSGDVLYGRLRPYLNKACMPSFDGVCSTDILVFQKQPFLSNKFIALFLITNRFVTYANANMTGVQHPRISFKNIAKFLIFLPPYNEQKRIVSKIESIFTRIGAVERYIESTLRLLDLLKSNTLKQAFEGRLVPQDPDDEPAEFLLQIMKQEKQLIKSQKSSYGRKNVR